MKSIGGLVLFLLGIVSCTNNPKTNSTSSLIDSVKGEITRLDFLDTANVAKSDLEDVLQKYKPLDDFEYDLHKANWGGDDRVILLNYFTEEQIYPKTEPSKPIVIREIRWHTDQDSFIVYWFQKEGDSWSYICNSDIYPNGTEF